MILFVLTEDVSDTENVGQICSPIRVSPDGNDRRPTSGSRKTREKLWSRSGRLPVKQRLYLSKQKIGTCFKKHFMTLMRYIVIIHIFIYILKLFRGTETQCCSSSPQV